MNEIEITNSTNAAPDGAKAIARADSTAVAVARWIATSRISHAVILVAIVAYCFGRTLGSYFLADDFGEISYIHRIFHGDPGLFWSNFTGNYMQVPGMSVYRPVLLITLVLDYLVWGANAFGYYATNILYFAGCCLLLYELMLHLTGSWTLVRSRLTALSAAALFAAYPLHGESVSWVVGRVDIACCFYYLLSLYLFTRWLGIAACDAGTIAVDAGAPMGNAARDATDAVGAVHAPPLRSSRLLVIGSVAAFGVAILTKEMSIGLPVVASAIALIFPLPSRRPVGLRTDLHQAGGACPAPAAGRAANPGGSTELRHSHSAQLFMSRLKRAAALTLPLWLATAVYFAVRYLALGTFVGGYTGGIGASQLSAIIQKWTDLDTFGRIAFPLNDSVFHGHGLYPQLLAAAYFLLAVTIIIRLLSGAMPWSWLLFSGIWLATAAAPIYQLWGLGYNLEGSRFLFFLSVPLSVLAAVVALAPSDSGSHLGRQLARRVTLVNIGALSLLVFTCARVCYLNNIPWVHAGKTVRAVQRQAQLLAERLPAGKKAIVLGIPKDHGGAHMILNGATFTMMMSEPFLKTNAAERFLTFDPALFGDPTRINAARLKASLSDPRVAGAYLWKTEAGQFTRIKFGGSSVAHLSAAGFNTVDGITLFRGDLNPLSCDFVMLKLSQVLGGNRASIAVSWQGEQRDGHGTPVVVPAIAAGNDLSVLIPLSRYWSWYAAGTIKSLTVRFNSFQSVRLISADLLPASLVTPALAMQGATCSLRGVFEQVPPAATVHFDGSRVPGSAAVRVEISRPNYFFEQSQDSAAGDAALTVRKIDGQQGAIAMGAFGCSEHAYYQIRARCLDRDGKPLGDYSDPITVRF